MSDACLPLNNENYGDPFRITHFRLHLTLISSLDSLHSSLQLLDNVSALTSQILKKGFKPTFRKNTLNRNFSVKLKMSIFINLFIFLRTRNGIEKDLQNLQIRFDRS